MVIWIRKIVICAAIFFISGCTTKPMSEPTIGLSVLASSLEVQKMILDEKFIYVITEGDKNIEDSYLHSNKIERIPKTGGKVKTLIEEELQYNTPIIDDEYIYWTAVNAKYRKETPQYVKKIRINGGKASVIYQEDDLKIGSLLQDTSNLYILSWESSSINKITQIRKSDNSPLVFWEGEETVYDVIIQDEYIYWTTCTYDNEKKESQGQIIRRLIEGEKNEAVLSDDCYFHPFVSDRGVYWVGDNIIFINRITNTITTIIKSNELFPEKEGIQPTEYKHVDVYLGSIIHIDEISIYFSEVHTAVSGFKSCTDSGEIVKKISIKERTITEITSSSGEIENVYRIGDDVFIFGDCDRYDYRILHLVDDDVENVSLGGVEQFAVDDERIYWTNEKEELWTRGRDDE
jgi:hypothetical protein